MYFLRWSVVINQVSNWFCWTNHYFICGMICSYWVLVIWYPNFSSHMLKPEVESWNLCEPEMAAKNKDLHQKSSGSHIGITYVCIRLGRFLVKKVQYIRNWPRITLTVVKASSIPYFFDNILHPSIFTLEPSIRIK